MTELFYLSCLISIFEIFVKPAIEFLDAYISLDWNALSTEMDRGNKVREIDQGFEVCLFLDLARKKHRLMEWRQTYFTQRIGYRIIPSSNCGLFERLFYIDLA